MMNANITSHFFANKWHTFFWSILLLSPILGWLSVLILGLLGLSQLRFSHEFLSIFKNRSVWIASAIILLYLIMLFTFGRVYEFSWKALKFPAGLLVPMCLYVWFSKRKINEDFVTRSAVYAVIMISVLMGLEWLFYRVIIGIDVRVRGLSANTLFVSAMLLPLQLIAIHNFQHAAHAFKKTIIISWLMGLICLAVFLGARSSFMIMLVLSFTSFLWQMEGKRKKLNFISITLVLTGLLVALLYLFADKLDFVRRMKMLLDFVITFDVHNMTDVSMKIRLDTWQAAWHAIEMQPWKGYGFAKEYQLLTQYLPKGAYVPPTCHQEYLSFMLGAGVFGLVSGILYLLFPLFAMSVNRANKRLAMCLVAPFLLNGFTDTLFDDLRIMFFYTTIGIMLTAIQVERCSPSKSL